MADKLPIELTYDFEKKRFSVDIEGHQWPEDDLEHLVNLVLADKARQAADELDEWIYRSLKDGRYRFGYINKQQCLYIWMDWMDELPKEAATTMSIDQLMALLVRSYSPDEYDPEIQSMPQHIEDIASLLERTAERLRAVWAKADS